MKGIAYLLFRFWIFALLALFTSPILWGAIELSDYCKDHEQYRKIEWIFSAFAAVWFFGLAWLANRTALHMAFENQKFIAALKFAIHDLRIRLAFLPVIGHWLEPKNRDEDDDHDS